MKTLPLSPYFFPNCCCYFTVTALTFNAEGEFAFLLSYLPPRLSVSFHGSWPYLCFSLVFQTFTHSDLHLGGEGSIHSYFILHILPSPLLIACVCVLQTSDSCILICYLDMLWTLMLFITVFHWFFFKLQSKYIICK